MKLFVSRSLAIIALAAVAGCKGDSTAPPTPSSVAPDPASTIAEGTVAAVLTPAPGFIVKDGNGNALGGVSVTVTVTAGGGTLTDAPTQTRAGGATPVGQWKLGNVAGVNTITVTVGSLPPLVISVNGKAGPPVSMAFVSGTGGNSFAGTIVQPSPTVQVRDAFGNGVAGASVLFSVTEGGGSVGSAAVVTNAAGQAAASQWRVGKSAVPQSLTASSGGLSAVATAFITTDYNIDLRFFGPTMPPAAAVAFNAAAARIIAVVTGDQPDVFAGTNGTDLTQCGIPGVTLTGVVDDVVIYATVEPIDGPGNVLGSAGPCFVRQTGRQTVLGRMRFDSEDINLMVGNGTLGDVIQHEMLHVVGIGSLWQEYGLLAGAGTPQTRFTGALGVGACIAMGGAAVCPGSVPVEDKFGPGSADSHWREAVFGTELMTSRIGGSFNPLSLMSIQSLADIGYVVNTSAADSYSIPGQSILGDALSNTAPANHWDEVEKPKFFISPQGRVTRMEKR
jgi:hypothetical protein